MRDDVKRGSRDGFILYAVLSVTALLSVLFLSLSLQTRSAVDTASVAILDLSADALLQSGVALAGYELFVLDQPAASLNGQQIRLDDGTITLSAVSTGAKVDLNGSAGPLLQAAYRASGLRAMTPAAFAGHVIDWRDRDGEAGSNGAEVEDYAAAGLGYGPRNGEFRQVGDLSTVLGISSSDARLLSPYLTVHNPAGRLDVVSTPADLLNALPGMKPEVVERLLALRAAAPTAAAEDLKTTLAEQAEFFEFEEPTAYLVTIQAQPVGTPRPKDATAILIASTDKSKAFQIADWRDDVPAPN